MLQYSFMQNAFLISILISILCPCIGIFLVLRRYSMIGDTLSHASLAGIAIGLLSSTNPIIGAFLFTSLCGVLIELLRDFFKKYAELILSIILSLSVGIAITIISSGKIHANVNSFIFGSILTVTQDDLYTVVVLSVISVITLIKLYNELLIISFDEEAAKIAKVKVKLINYVFALLVSATIAVSIRIVGILVLSSMISLPVAAAMQLKKGFKTTLISSIIISLVNIIIALFVSYYIGCAPGGIIAIMSVISLILIIIFNQLAKVISIKKLDI